MKRIKDYYCYSFDGKLFHGNYKNEYTVERAVRKDHVIGRRYNVRQIIIAQWVPFEFDALSADVMIEILYDAMIADGKVPADILEYVFGSITSPQIKELDLMLENAFKPWVKKNKITKDILMPKEIRRFEARD